jgi:hypothetical protein
VKKRLCLGLKSRNESTRRKYATFLFVVFCFFSGVGTVKASSVTVSASKGPEKVVSVSAVVPLTPEFFYLIRKNSDITLQKKAFVVGEENTIQVTIRGGRGEYLKNHRVTLQISDEKKEILTSLSTTTDDTRRGVFFLRCTKLFLGRMTIRVADISYGEPAWLMEQLHFIVYETESAKEKAEKNMGQSAIWTQYLERERSVGFVPQKNDDFSEKNATMDQYPLEILFQGKSP